MKLYHLVAASLIVVGVLLAGIAIRYFVRVLLREKVMGRIESGSASRSGGGTRRAQKVHRTFVVRYAHDSESYAFELRTGSGALPHYRVGKAIRLAIDRDHPENAVPCDIQQILLRCGLLLLACVLSGIGILMLLVQFGVLQTTPA